MRFEWDERKNDANRKKHGLSLEEASAIFEGPVFTRSDLGDYGEENREISVGMISWLVVIVVVHTERDGWTRLISARKATRKEAREYYEYLKEATRGDCRYSGRGDR